MCGFDFVHLHTHSCFSKRDALSRVDHLVKRAKAVGSKAVALTDHGVLHGIPELFREAQKHNLKGVAGMEGYLSLTPRGEPSQHYHQIILAKNEIGWKNLMRLSSEGFLSGFYNRPRFDWELLKECSEGLIVTSSCLSGVIPQLILEDQLKEAYEWAKRFKEVFSDDFYLEIQPNTIPAQQIVNSELIRMSKELSIELIATVDAHYPTQQDWKTHQAMLCLGRGKRMLMDDTPRYDGEPTYYLMDPEEVFEGLVAQGITPEVATQAINNTGKVADKINFELKKERDLLPEFPLPEGVADKDKHLGELVKKGLLRKVHPITQEYIDRVKYELGVIREKGYQDYFLIVSDALRWCKSQGIAVGPGRGSGAGSLVAYLLDITEVDPIRYGLFFERFLDVTRQKLPDIDSDLEDTRREELLEYLRQKYGRESVAQIANYGRMSARLAFKNALMVYDIPFREAQEISNLIPETPKVTIEEAYRLSPQLVAKRKEKLKRNDGKDVELEEIYQTAEKFELAVDKLGKHAAGVIIAPGKIMEYFPIFLGSSKEVVTQWDKDDLEELGGVKFDFLGLKTLSTISLAIRSIEEETGVKIYIDKILRDPNDPKVYKLISSGKTGNLFQFNSSGMQQLCKAVQPSKFEHLVAITALYRPAALSSGDTWRYARIKNGQEPEVYSHPEEKAITGETYGIITYQEHVMQLVHHFAGWEYGRGDKLRKMKTDELEALREEFLRDSTSRGYPEEAMNEIWTRIVNYMGYGFNKAHGVSYSLITYLTAWLETYYPAHWMAAILTTKMGEQETLAKMIGEIRALGLELSPPDINLSSKAYRVAGTKIVLPLGAIKGIGEKAIDEILKNRKENPYGSIAHLLERCDLRVVNKRVMKALTFAGAFDSVEFLLKDRKAIWLEYLRLKGEPKRVIAKEEEHDWNETIQAETEKELLGIYLTSHPLSKYNFRPWSEYPDGSRECYTGGTVAKMRKHRDKNNNEMAFLQLETLNGAREVIVFASTYKKYKEFITKGKTLMIKGKKDGEKMIANSIKELT